jgi:hypothetical protein
MRQQVRCEEGGGGGERQQSWCAHCASDLPASAGDGGQRGGHAAHGHAL